MNGYSQELNRITELLTRYIAKGNDGIRKDDIKRGDFVVFGYGKKDREATIHDMVPLVLVWDISLSLTKQNGYLLGFNLHHVINKDVRKFIIETLDKAGSANKIEFLLRAIGDLEKTNRRLYTLMDSSIKATVRRYDFFNIATKIKVLSQTETEEYLGLLGKNNFDKIIDENEVDRKPLSELFYNKLKG